MMNLDRYILNNSLKLIEKILPFSNIAVFMPYQIITVFLSIAYDNEEKML